MEAAEFSRVASTLPEAYLLLTAEGEVLAANPAARRVLRTERAHLEGQSLAAFSSLAAGDLAARLQACARTCQPLPVATGIADAEGGHLQAVGWLQRPLVGGQPPRILLKLQTGGRFASRCLMLNQEIAQQNKTLRLLRHSQEQLRRVRDQMCGYVDIVDKHVITSSTDAQGIITRASEAFCRISQYSREELVGRSHNIVRHPDMPASLYQDLWRTIRRGQVWHGEIKNRAKDGSAYWVAVNIEPKFDAQGVITGYTAIRQDITDRKRVEELSVRDPLTQLFNRLRLNEVLQLEGERATRYGSALGVVLLDVDHFKRINDSFGHPAGDRVLLGIAQHLAARVRHVDVLGRWGGEEFMVICAGTDLMGAARLAEDLRASLHSRGFDAVGQVTCSLGVAACRQGDTAASLVQRADEVLYRAKACGRDRVETAM
jgi:diguanylate cyclase (GGDEF)-like protein/PAS domain S-box-containing protein